MSENGTPRWLADAPEFEDAVRYESERALYYRDLVPFNDVLAAMRAISEAL